MKMVDPSQITDPINQTPTESKDNFWEITGLPSKMKLYPTGTVIKGRPLKTIEVKKLATINKVNMDTIIDETISSAIIGVDVNDILVSDKLYILFWLRANTYKESGFNVDFYCDQCESPSSYDFIVDNIKTIDINDDFDIDKKLTLPSSEDVVTINLLTIADTKATTQFLKSREKTLRQFDEEIITMASHIKTINGEEVNSLLNRYEYMEELNPSDYAYITSYINHVDFGINNNLEVECQKCGGTSHAGVTFRAEFFLPQYKF